MKKFMLLFAFVAFAVSSIHANCWLLEGDKWVYHPGKNCKRDFKTNIPEWCKDVASPPAPGGGTSVDGAEIREDEGKLFLYLKINGVWLSHVEVTTEYELPADISEIRVYDEIEE